MNVGTGRLSLPPCCVRIRACVRLCPDSFPRGEQSERFAFLAHHTHIACQSQIGEWTRLHNQLAEGKVKMDVWAAEMGQHTWESRCLKDNGQSSGTHFLCNESSLT